MESGIPKVLISYAHDSPEQTARVRELADKLRQDGIDCHIDQYESSPPEGWPRWMKRQLESSEFVLVVCTEIYFRRFDGKEEAGKGLGAQWEGSIITQDLYDSAAQNTKFIPVVFAEADVEFIPKDLRGATRYRVDRDDGYEDLYRRLTEQPRVKKPPLGKKRVLHPINSSTSEVSTAEIRPETETEMKSNVSTTLGKASQLTNLTLLFLDNGRFIFLPAARIEQNELISLELLPNDDRKTAFLSDINDKYNRPTIAVAFRSTAVGGTLQSSTTLHTENGESWQLKIRPIESHYSSLADFTVNNYTPEDIAELRARRILLNEQPSRTPGRDGLMDGLTESMISRSEGFIKEIRSPLPELYKLISDDTEYFLEAARLMCILYLKLTGTVEHIFKLHLNQTNNKNVDIEFEGQRRARYANQPPHIIRFTGRCALV